MDETKMTERELLKEARIGRDAIDLGLLNFVERVMSIILDKRMAELSSRWDLNDFPDDQEPKDASEANVVRCELARLLADLNRPDRSDRSDQS